MSGDNVPDDQHYQHHFLLLRMPSSYPQRYIITFLNRKIFQKLISATAACLPVEQNRAVKRGAVDSRVRRELLPQHIKLRGGGVKD